MKQYKLTLESLSSITDAEMAFGTSKLLPDYADVPEEFKQGNIYTKMMSCIFFGSKLPEGEVSFRSDFDGAEVPELLQRVIHAHLKSWGPKHEHKIAGVGYLVSLVCEIRPA